MPEDKGTGCEACSERGGQAFRQPFSMAFQPIFDVHSGAVFAQEALVRPAGGGSARDVLQHVTQTNRYSFDQACRTRAIAIASRLGIDSRLSINFMPNAVYNPDSCIQATLRAAERFEFPTERLVFEFTEGEAVRDTGHLQNIVRSYRSRGFLTAIDDFGAGYAGLGLLCDLQPDIVKIDMALVRGIAADERRRVVVAAIAGLCGDLGILPIAEGIETAEDAAAVRELGIRHMQGYHFAPPAYERLVLKPEGKGSAAA
ncbi:EAL domain-containing protein [Pseudoroseicyclus tamaricis]|uniref:EAL domain-containing protein n=1 Tax=Pseudoroseicyclus tamaricis TaxID=2705421 RepID=A0A6B2JW71_9RHOB|nr:EAL domain-containing protein [Pseudoroseicyclus tamaricis]NDV02155.1 EAL domain-containing protein [Pseudoroseicyclus tamaricis]